MLILLLRRPIKGLVWWFLSLLYPNCTMPHKPARATGQSLQPSMASTSRNLHVPLAAVREITVEVDFNLKADWWKKWMQFSGKDSFVSLPQTIFPSSWYGTNVRNKLWKCSALQFIHLIKQSEDVAQFVSIMLLGRNQPHWSSTSSFQYASFKHVNRT
jgi:hypothetical protein